MDADDDEVRITLRLPKALHEHLAKEVESGASKSMNARIVEVLTNAMDAQNYPFAALSQIRVAVSKVSKDLRLLVQREQHFKKLCDTAWRKIQDEGRDPYEFFELKEPQHKTPKGS